MTHVFTRKLMDQKLTASEAPRTIIEAREKDELQATDSEEEKADHAPAQAKSSEKNANKDIDEELKGEHPDILYTCPFRFEKKAKDKNGIQASSSEDSLDFEELADFNKIMERQFRETISKEFHEKFHTIQDIQDKDIKKKLERMAKQRNTGTIKYLIKKRVNNFKDNIKDIKTKLEQLDENIEEFPESSRRASPLIEGRRSQSVPDGFSVYKSKIKLNKDGTTLVDEDHMKNAFDRFKTKYNVYNDDEILSIITKLNDKKVEEKFQDFVKYFKAKKKSRKVRQSKLPKNVKETEMLEEISKFVESEDFTKFFK